MVVSGRYGLKCGLLSFFCRLLTPKFLLPAVAFMPKKYARLDKALFWIQTEREAMGNLPAQFNSRTANKIKSPPVKSRDLHEGPGLSPSSTAGSADTDNHLAQFAAFRAASPHPLPTIEEAARWGWATASGVAIRSEKDADEKLLKVLAAELFPELDHTLGLARLALESRKRLRGERRRADHSSTWMVQPRADRTTLSRNVLRLLERLGANRSLAYDPITFLKSSFEILRSASEPQHRSSAKWLLAAIYQSIRCFEAKLSCRHCFRQPIPGIETCTVHSSSDFAKRIRDDNDIYLAAELGRPQIEWSPIGRTDGLPWDRYVDFVLPDSTDELEFSHPVSQQLMYCERVRKALGPNADHAGSRVLYRLLETRIDPMFRSNHDWPDKINEAERYFEAMEAPKLQRLIEQRIAFATKLARNGETSISAIARQLGVSPEAIHSWFRRGLAPDLAAIIRGHQGHTRPKARK